MDIEETLLPPPPPGLARARHRVASAGALPRGAWSKNLRAESSWQGPRWRCTPVARAEEGRICAFIDANHRARIPVLCQRKSGVQNIERADDLGSPTR